jgi:fucose permease
MTSIDIIYYVLAIIVAIVSIGMLIYNNTSHNNASHNNTSHNNISHFEVNNNNS